MASIRRADLADAPAIRAVASESWHAACDDLLGPETVAETVAAWYDLAELREEIEAPEDHVFVATDAGGERARTVVGFAHAGSDEETGDARLHRLYVVPGRWRSGIGRRLLERVETALEREGHDSLSLDVFAANEVGVSFYEATGFERVGAHEETFGGTTHAVASFEKRL